MDRDKAEAIKWYQKAAEHGDENANWSLCVMYFTGIEIPKDYVQAKKWCQKSAEDGYEDAQVNLGTMYYYGDGAPRDFSEAVKWFRKAADHDDEVAEFYLGLAYENGQGVLQDYVISYLWFSKSVAATIDKAGEHRDTIANEADEHRNKIAKEMSLSQFIDAQGKAARLGDGKAQLYLGEAYARGLAVPKDFVLSYMWLNLAASGGIEIAASERDDIAKKMTSEQIADAQRLTREWKPSK